MAITLKLGKAELWFFYTSLLLNEIYPPTKFEVDISSSFRVMSQTRNLQQTDPQTTSSLQYTPLNFVCGV